MNLLYSCDEILDSSEKERTTLLYSIYTHSNALNRDHSFL